MVTIGHNFVNTNFTNTGKGSVYDQVIFLFRLMEFLNPFGLTWCGPFFFFHFKSLTSIELSAVLIKSGYVALS